MNDMKGRTITIGSRESVLAVVQSKMVIQFLEETYPGADVRLLTMKTTGDKILDRRLDQIGGKGLFVKELDAALLDKRTDISVHSMKDLPMQIPEELPVLCCPAREDPRDVLVLPAGQTEWMPGKPVGTSSRRRFLQLQKLMPEASFESVRGNLQTRLRKLDEGQYSALVLAAAGLMRLGLEERISRYFSPEEVIPAACQGILALQGRAGENYDYLAPYADDNAMAEAACERGFVKELDGGCTTPIAAHAQAAVADGAYRIKMYGLYYNEETGRFRTAVTEGTAESPAGCETFGRTFAAGLRNEVDAL